MKRREYALYILLFVISIMLIIMNDYWFEYIHAYTMRSFNAYPWLIYTLSIICLFSGVVISKFAVFTQMPAKYSLVMAAISAAIMFIALPLVYFYGFIFFGNNHVFISILLIECLMELLLYKYVKGHKRPISPTASPE